MADEKDIKNEEELHEDKPLIENDNSFSGYFHERDHLAENNIVNEVETSFLEYSMSVIASRALPDLRDGLKPVHRRILWAMYESGYSPSTPHRKSATTVGYVMGHYHPHGDSSIYEAMVRMAQDFSYRYMLVDGHGNFGNIEGDGAAAMRYTESRLSKISLELLKDINKDTVDFDPNFDESEKEPKVLPSRFPNILVNGTMGIAVGMATNIPPHNLGEVIDGCIAYIDNPDIDTLGLMQHIKGPDFPTGGLILGNSGIKQAYDTGRGTITIRSKAEIIEKNGHNQIVITEVPYGVNTMDLKTKVAELVRNKIIEGITDYHTDLKDGVKITITLKKESNPQVVLNNLYKHTSFQVNYGIIFLMLDGLTPRTLPLKSIISKYLDHQKDVIVRRTSFDLKKDQNRVHILEGYKIAQDNIDEVVHIIRNANGDDDAKNTLMEKFALDSVQADAILELKLRRLTSLERGKIVSELDALLIEIADLKDILEKPQRVLDIIKKEMLEIKNKYGDDRRTSIDMTAVDYIEDESLIPVEDMIIASTVNGYIKRMPVDLYRQQKRGGRGVKGMNTNEDDIIEKFIHISTHDDLLLFTNKGKVYRLRGYEVPESGRTSKGIPALNLIDISKEEKVRAMIGIKKESIQGDENLFFATKTGIVKRVPISEFENIRKSGKIAITMREDDELVDVKVTSGNDEIIIAGSNGKAVRFNENEVRSMGRTAMGVKGFNVDGSQVVGMATNNEGEKILIITEKGYGKKSELSEYRLTKRGAKGVKTVNITEKNGQLVTMKAVNGDEDVMIITDDGIVIRITLEQVSTYGRTTQGVKLINVAEGHTVSTVAVLDKSEDEAIDEEETTSEIVEVKEETSEETPQETKNEE